MPGINRVLIIGIDGATFDLIQPWIDEGRLPNLRKIYEKGASCVLNSTLPPNSAPAWTSLLTGMNPGKHGVYGFTRVEPMDGYAIKVNSGARRRVPTAWQYLSTLGFRVITLNVPMTYPPDSINGLVVTGIDAPGLDSEFTYPRELRKEILHAIPDYLLDVRSWGVMLKGERRANLFEDILRMVESRRKLALHLLHTRDWDFFTVVFTASDRVQHFFWRFLDPDHPLYEAVEALKYQDAILKVYKQIDLAIGEILAVCEEGIDLIVMSDHGFGPQRRLFRINQWLFENGYLKLLDASKNGFLPRAGISADGRIYRGLIWLINFARAALSDTKKDRLKRLFPRLRERIASLEALSMIDWQTTKAYHTTEFPGAIRVNKRGREVQGIVNSGEEYETLCDSIRQDFETVTDPETGRRIIEKVYRREELYWGPYMELAPDLIVSPADYSYTFDWRIPVRGSGRAKYPPLIDHLTSEYSANCGAHRPEGILMLNGRHIRQGVRLELANIYDVMPTALYLAGVPLLKEMDGRILTEAILPEFLSSHPCVFAEQIPIEAKNSREEIYSREEADLLAERLRDLGYL